MTQAPLAGRAGSARSSVTPRSRAPTASRGSTRSCAPTSQTSARPAARATPPPAGLARGRGPCRPTAPPAMATRRSTMTAGLRPLVRGRFSCPSLARPRLLTAAQPRATPTCLSPPAILARTPSLLSFGSSRTRAAPRMGATSGATLGPSSASTLPPRSRSCRRGTSTFSPVTSRLSSPLIGR